MTPDSNRFTALMVAGVLSFSAMAGGLDDVSARLERGQYDQALRLLQALPGDQLEARFLKSTALAGAGRDDEAIAELEALIGDYPEQPEPYNNLASLYAARGDFEKAKALLEQALRTSASYATVYENLSAVYVEMTRSSYAKALRVKRTAAPQLALLSAIENGSLAAPAPVPVAQAPVSPPPAGELPVATVPPPVPAAPAEQQPIETAKAATEVAASAAAPDSAIVGGTAEDEPLQQAVVSALQDWAAAWSKQDVERYLKAYSGSFTPEDGLSRARWAQVRRVRLKRPDWIDVQLSDFDVRFESDRAVVELTQTYGSDTYRDRTLKRMELMRHGDAWEITSEETLKILP